MLLLIKNGLFCYNFTQLPPKKHPFELNLPPTYKYIPENLFLQRSSVELEISDFLPLGGFLLNISPLPTVQNSSKKSILKINAHLQFSQSVLFERPAITYLIYVDKHGCFPSQKLVMCK